MLPRMPDRKAADAGPSVPPPAQPSTLATLKALPQRFNDPTTKAICVSLAQCWDAYTRLSDDVDRRKEELTQWASRHDDQMENANTATLNLYSALANSVEGMQVAHAEHVAANNERLSEVENRVEQLELKDDGRRTAAEEARTQALALLKTQKQQAAAAAAVENATRRAVVARCELATAAARAMTVADIVNDPILAPFLVTECIAPTIPRPVVAMQPVIGVHPPPEVSVHIEEPVSSEDSEVSAPLHGDEAQEPSSSSTALSGGPVPSMAMVLAAIEAQNQRLEAQTLEIQELRESDKTKTKHIEALQKETQQIPGMKDDLGFLKNRAIACDLPVIALAFFEEVEFLAMLNAMGGSGNFQWPSNLTGLPTRRDWEKPGVYPPMFDASAFDANQQRGNWDRYFRRDPETKKPWMTVGDVVNVLRASLFNSGNSSKYSQLEAEYKKLTRGGNHGNDRHRLTQWRARPAHPPSNLECQFMTAVGNVAASFGKPGWNDAVDGYVEAVKATENGPDLVAAEYHLLGQILQVLQRAYSL